MFIQRFKTYIYGLIGFLALIGAIFYVKDFVAIDDCLDSGGRWNKVIRSCEEWPNRKFELKIES